MLQQLHVVGHSWEICMSVATLLCQAIVIENTRSVHSAQRSLCRLHASVRLFRWSWRD